MIRSPRFIDSESSVASDPLATVSSTAATERPMPTQARPPSRSPRSTLAARATKIGDEALMIPAFSAVVWRSPQYQTVVFATSPVRPSTAEHRRAALTSSFSSWPSFSSRIHLLPVASCRHAKDGPKSCQEEKPTCRGFDASSSLYLGPSACDVTLTSLHPRGTVATPAPPT